jgi:hypothetical protein
MPQNGAVADRHAETLHQPFSRSAARSVSEKMNKFCDSLGSPSVRTNNFRQLIRKCPTLTLPVQTSPTAHLHPHHHGGALHRQVLKMTNIPAMPTRRGLVASGTGAFPAPRQRSPSDRHPARPQKSARPAQEPNPCSFACSRLSARRPIKPNSTECEADPFNVQRHLTSRRTLHVLREEAFQTWRAATAA